MGVKLSDMNYSTMLCWTFYKKSITFRKHFTNKYVWNFLLVSRLSLFRVEYQYSSLERSEVIPSYDVVASGVFQSLQDKPLNARILLQSWTYRWLYRATLVIIHLKVFLPIPAIGWASYFVSRQSWTVQREKRATYHHLPTLRGTPSPQYWPSFWAFCNA